ncbi:cupin domain-containing protein [Halobaculum sp. CBA1158]|uniref:cupin domain-containing protein n=1 Tax=Halobaculum sp. CBA1158 TaxID=2904243 RepID=UPI001F46FDEF|nr:cupin domain-containing protein [Halobaculum sp. CBA1158]UIP00184.1 cupin domain-containing protein [Halobaculum sp. CBA1158]
MSETDPTTATGPEPTVKRGNDLVTAEVDAGDGMSKGVLIDESDGAPHFAMRRFELAPGARVPNHTNEVEHEQYVLAGEYTVGLDGEEYTVAEGDALLIPSGVPHWYRNDGDEAAAFICVVPHGDDTIRVLDDD